MRHLILGNGRLGKALFKVLSADKDDDVTLWSMRVSGLTTPEAVRKLLINQGLGSAVIWNCMGYGSVAQCKVNPEEASIVHVAIPDAITKLAIESGTPVIHFSSNYAIEPELSYYAKTKKLAEDLCGKNSIVIRVANLYSADDPVDSMFGRMVMKAKSGPLQLSDNHVYPTPVEWLATFLVWSQVWRLKPGVYRAIPDGGSLLSVAMSWFPPGSCSFAGAVDIDMERPMQYEETEPYHYAHNLLPAGHRYTWKELMKNYAPNLYDTIVQRLHLQDMFEAEMDKSLKPFEKSPDDSISATATQ